MHVPSALLKSVVPSLRALAIMCTGRRALTEWNVHCINAANKCNDAATELYQINLADLRTWKQVTFGC